MKPPKLILILLAGCFPGVSACQKSDSGKPEAIAPPDPKIQEVAKAVAAGGPAGISPDDPASLQKALQQAVRAGLGEIVIPPGVYRIPPLPTGGGADAWHLVVEKAKNLKIEAAGVTLVFTDRGRSSLTFQQCENVTLRGATSPMSMS